ncbi:MAG TPA: hypothetical protein ENJ90_00825 [Devosia sp.]|nr:hypothetical protein [Devosia sp.]
MSASLLTRLISFVLALGFAGIFLPVHADELGSPAWVISDTDLRSGPGIRYPVVASAAKGDAVVVSRCSDRWCRIAGSDDWLSIDQLSFGQTARGPYSGPKFETRRGGPGQVCFFDGLNYSGNSVCQPSGGVARDLLLLGWDNKIASVSIDGDVSVNLCRDRNFASYCVLVDQSTPKLDRLLLNAASSWQVW